MAQGALEPTIDSANPATSGPTPSRRSRSRSCSSGPCDRRLPAVSAQSGCQSLEWSRVQKRRRLKEAGEELVLAVDCGIAPGTAIECERVPVDRCDRTHRARTQLDRQANAVAGACYGEGARCVERDRRRTGEAHVGLLREEGGRFEDR